MIPIAQAWKAFDEKGVPQQSELVEQLHALGKEVVRGSCQFALEPPTKEDTAKTAKEEPEVSKLN